MLIAFPQQQRFDERASTLRHTFIASLVSTEVDNTYRFCARVTVELLLVVHALPKRWQKRSSTGQLTSVVLEVLQLMKQTKG
jgi:hypothetical protein